MRRNKLVIVFVMIILMGGILIYFLPSKSIGRTIEEAIEKSGRKIVKIVYEEKVKNGEVVFFYKSINGGKDYTVASAYISKTLGGWKWENGGEHSHSDFRNPITVQYFPATENTPFPLAFGEISDEQIMQVKVQTEARALDKEIKIVNSDSHRIWFVFLNPSDGSKIKVLGLSQSGQILASAEDY